MRRRVLLPLLTLVVLVVGVSALPASADTATGTATGTASTATSAPSTSSTTSTDPGPLPVDKVGTDETANHPVLIIGTALVALALIGAGAVLARNRLRDDDF